MFLLEFSDNFQDDLFVKYLIGVAYVKHDPPLFTIFALNSFHQFHIFCLNIYH